MWCTSRLPTKFGRTNYDELLSFQIIFNAFHTIYRFGDTFSTVALCLGIDGTGELNHAVGGFNFHMTGRDDIVRQQRVCLVLAVWLLIWGVIRNFIGI